MSAGQSAKETALCGTVVLAVWFSAWLAGFGSAVVQTTAALPVQDRPAALLTADAERASVPRPAAVYSVPAVNADVTPAAAPETAMAADITAASDAPKLFVEAAPFNSSPPPAPEQPLVQMASANSSDPLPIDTKPAVGLIEIPDECLDTCIDDICGRFINALPRRTRLRCRSGRK